MAALIPAGGTDGTLAHCPLPALCGRARTRVGNCGDPKPRPRPPGPERLWGAQGTPEGWRGGGRDSPAAGTGTRGSVWGVPGAGAQPAVPGAGEGGGQSLGGPGCGRAPLSAAIPAAFPAAAAAAAREPLSPVTNVPCGRAQPPQRFPSVATFTRALGPLVPREIVKCLLGQEINLLCKVSHCRLGLRGVYCAGGR